LGGKEKAKIHTQFETATQYLKKKKKISNKKKESDRILGNGKKKNQHGTEGEKGDDALQSRDNPAPQKRRASMGRKEGEPAASSTGGQTRKKKKKGG